MDLESSGLSRLSILHLDIKACATTTAAGSKWVINDLELRADQLHCKVDFAALEEIERWLIENDLRALFRGCGRISVIGNVLENRIVLVHDG